MTTETTVRHPFMDGVRRDECILHVWPAGTLFDGLKVEHPGCACLADVSADLDAWYCPACSRSGRVSGAWAVDMWQQGQVTDIATLEHDQVREHVTDILFDSQGSVDANCTLCQKGVELGIWAEFGYPDPFSEDDE